MSVLGAIMSEVFHGGGVAPGPAGASPQPGLPRPPQPASASPSRNAPSPSPAEAAPTRAVDVGDALGARANEAGAGDEWKSSPGALLALLGLSADRPAQAELARELALDEGAGDAAVMRDLWRKLAEVGGKVPEDLRG